MKMLLTQLRRIGDVITTTPAVRAIRAAWPDATIDYLTEPPSHEIFKNSPYINNIYVVDRRASLKQYASLIKELRKNKYDVAMDFFGNPTSAYITWLSGAKHRIGFNLRFRKHFYNHTVDESLFPEHTYAGLHKLALAAETGVMPVGYEPEFPIDEKKQKDADNVLLKMGINRNDALVTIGASTRHEFRQWPLERFAYIADKIIERSDAKVLFVYGPGEEKHYYTILEHMKHTPLPAYPYSTLSRLRGIFQRAALHIGCDNGIANIAKASGIPNIVLYSNAKASSWTPPSDNGNYITFEKDMECKLNGRCLREKCPEPLCIKSIDPDEVLEAALKVLKNAETLKLNSEAFSPAFE